MAPPSLVRGRWRVRSWIQDPQGACVTNKKKEEKKKKKP
jgi:hypothetical protein